MEDQTISWDALLARGKGRGFLAQQFFAIFTYPAKSFADIEAKLAEHLKFQIDLEERGIMFAAGPLCDVETNSWKGRGLVVVRAADLEAAKQIAAADPMHSSGARRFEVIPWCVNEGGFDVRIRYSKGTFDMLTLDNRAAEPAADAP